MIDHPIDLATLFDHFIHPQSQTVQKFTILMDPVKDDIQIDGWNKVTNVEKFKISNYLAPIMNCGIKSKYVDLQSNI